MSPEETPTEVTTDVADLGGITLSGIFALQPQQLGETVSKLTDRAMRPGRSISGYNPQRIEDDQS